jgi:hypothetical protein
MKVDWQLFRFPFDDERWKNKAVIGALLGMLSVVVWPLYLPLWGYGVRVMRQTATGERPTLPDWDEWGNLFGDGLRFFVVSFVYGIPAWLPMCCGFAFLVFGFLPGLAVGAAAQEAQSPELAAFGVGSIVVANVVGYGLLGVGGLLGLLLGFVGLVAQTRWVALGSFNSAFEFGEVWRLMRGGINNYLLAFAVWYGGIYIASFIASFFLLTVVLCCVYPPLLGVLVTYSALLMGALYGMAYHHTQAGLAEAEAAAR